MTIKLVPEQVFVQAPAMRIGLEVHCHRCSGAAEPAPEVEENHFAAPSEGVEARERRYLLLRQACPIEETTSSSSCPATRRVGRENDVRWRAIAVAAGPRTARARKERPLPERPVVRERRTEERRRCGCWRARADAGAGPCTGSASCDPPSSASSDGSSSEIPEAWTVPRALLAWAGANPPAAAGLEGVPVAVPSVEASRDETTGRCEERRPVESGRDECIEPVVESASGVRAITCGQNVLPSHHRTRVATAPAVRLEVRARRPSTG